MKNWCRIAPFVMAVAGAEHLRHLLLNPPGCPCFTKEILESVMQSLPEDAANHYFEWDNENSKTISLYLNDMDNTNKQLFYVASSKAANSYQCYYSELDFDPKWIYMDDVLFEACVAFLEAAIEEYNIPDALNENEE